MKRQLIALITAGVLALIGVAALVVYANRADDRAYEGTKLVEVLRVTAEMPAKTPASELSGSVKIAKLPRSAVVPGAITSLDDLTGLVTKSILVPGDQLTTQKFAKPEAVKGDTALPKGMQQLTIPVSGPRLVGGVVVAGDSVGVFSSYDGVTANPINHLLVLSVNTPTADGNSDTAAATQITVAVKTLDAEKIIHTMEFGKIWLTLQNDETDTGGGKTISSKDVAP